MVRWGRIWLVLAVAMALFAPGAQAASPYAKATVASCDRDAREAVFEGRVLTFKWAAKMQLRFTLQANDSRTTRAGGRSTLPASDVDHRSAGGFAKYTYDKTVQDAAGARQLPRGRRTSAGATARGHDVRPEKAISPICRQPDARPDLVVRGLIVENGERYVAVILNRGREAAGAFAVDFLRDSSRSAPRRSPRSRPRRRPR